MGEVLNEPCCGQTARLLQRARLLEQVTGSGDHDESCEAGESRRRFLVEIEHHRIAAADQ
jgi:hypothetical protein